MTEGSGIFARGYRLRTAGLLMLVTFVAFETMAVGTAMPTAVAELGGLAWYGWAFSAFLVTSLVGMVVGGDVGDRRGARAALLAGVALFVAGLLVAGFAGSMAVLVLGRAVQGLGSGLIGVSMYVVAGQAYPAPLRPALFGAFSSAWVLPGVIGPLLSGLVTEHATWRLAFLGLVPLVLLGLLLVLPALRSLPVSAGGAEPAAESVAEPAAEAVADPAADVAGAPAAVPSRSDAPWWAATAGIGIVALQYAAQRRDLVSVPLALAGGVVLVLGLRRLLPAGTARARRGLPTVVASRGLLAGAFFGVDALLPLALTQLHGFGPVAAGFPLTTAALGWAVAALLQARLPRVPRVRILQAGFVLLAVGVAGTALAAASDVGGWAAYVTWAVAGAGMGLGMPSAGVLLFEHSVGERQGADSAAMQLADVTVSALTVGVVGVLIGGAAGSAVAGAGGGSGAGSGALPLTTAVLVAGALLAALAALGALVAGRAGVPSGGGTASPAPLGDPATTLERS